MRTVVGVRLRRSHPDRPGYGRRRSGKGFTYLDRDGNRLTDPEAVARCRSLVIPPAWRDVWICPYPNGHIQAVGTDDAGRRQYLYHPAWRATRDVAKHERVLDLAERLPAARRLVTMDLRKPGMPRERALAVAFRLLDIGFFRVGGESYADENGSYGLATLLMQHVHIGRDGRLTFAYRAKSGQARRLELRDDELIEPLTTMRRRRGGGEELLAYKDDRGWHDITSADINEYIKRRLGPDASAKDFRTWHGTVLAALELAKRTPEATTPTARKRAERAAVKSVAAYLGNTPAVARASYVNPRVIKLAEEGETIDPELARKVDPVDEEGPPDTRGAVEKAVLGLLD
ncbi:DNA topoisomerase IB [Georgenia thermotolerans]|uniref:DNA topoisomerase IB n=1 Tax=Georgenia thermotolerans TaxID=527326 RepID=UPI00186ACF16|nr:DNA topoisomerase IB [Georgenia thermotolerans]